MVARLETIWHNTVNTAKDEKEAKTRTSKKEKGKDFQPEWNEIFINTK